MNWTDLAQNLAIIVLGGAVYLQTSSSRHHSRAITLLSDALTVSRTAPRPEGVRVIHADGSSTPVELTYVGLDEAGCHEWEAITVLREGDQLQADVLPARTSIRFPTS